MKKKNANFILLTLVLALLPASGSAVASHHSSPSKCSGMVNQKLFYLWRVSQEKSLGCTLELTETFAPSSKLSVDEVQLAVYDGKTRIFSYLPHFYPESLFAVNDDMLGSLCTSPTSAYILTIFAYSNGRVRKVFDAGSKLRPEFVYSSKTWNQTGQCVIISDLEAGHDAITGKFTCNPTKAHIYTWTGKSFQLIRTVPWRDRLKRL